MSQQDLLPIAALLAQATLTLQPHSPTPRLDAELLLAHVLGCSRAWLAAARQDTPTPPQTAHFRQLVARRSQQEPVAYLVGHREFYGLDLRVDPRVLIPRPETELLVDLTLELIASISPAPPTPALIQGEGDSLPPSVGEGQGMGGMPGIPAPVPLSSCRDVACNVSPVATPPTRALVDVGTGSGAIALALAHHLPAAWTVYATDLSADALAVANHNAVYHQLDSRIVLLHGDLLAPLPTPVDIIVSNPPYTLLDEIDEGVRRYEPHLALDGGNEGVQVYHRLLADAPRWLRPGGAMLLEIGATQAGAVAAIAQAHFPTAHITTHQDLAGHDRVVVVSFR